MRKGSVALTPVVVSFLSVAAFLTVMYFALPQNNANTNTVNVNTTNTSLGVPAPGFENVNEMVVGNTNTDEAVETNTNTATDPTAGWETYTNVQYNFSVRYPEGEITQQTATNVRIQNYSTAIDILQLTGDQYYFEMAFVPEQAHNSSFCDENVQNGDSQRFGRLTGIFGTGFPGGDAGGDRTAAACFQTSGFTGVFTVTEVSGGTVGQKIINSLTFTE